MLLSPAFSWRGLRGTGPSWTAGWDSNPSSGFLQSHFIYPELDTILQTSGNTLLHSILGEEKGDLRCHFMPFLPVSAQPVEVAWFWRTRGSMSLRAWWMFVLKEPHESQCYGEGFWGPCLLTTSDFATVNWSEVQRVTNDQSESGCILEYTSWEQFWTLWSQAPW